MQLPSENMPLTSKNHVKPRRQKGVGDLDRSSYRGRAFTSPRACQGCSRRCPGHARCTRAPHAEMQGRCLQALCHAAFLFLRPPVWFFLQLTQFLKVREQAKTVGEHLSKAVDPGRKALPSWRAEEGLSYRSGWDLKPALSSSLPLQAMAGQFPKARAGRFGFRV